MVTDMRVNLPGLLKERQRSGRFTYRVRVAGQKHRKIAIGVDLDHPDFMARYRMARGGTTPGAVGAPPQHIPHSVAWLVAGFEKAMQERVEAGAMHPSTLQQRSAFYARLCADYGDKAMVMPRSKVLEIRDGMIATPGAADNMVKAIRALYAWGIERGHVTENPATGVGKINRGTGAVPWSIDDLQAYRDRHPKGTMPHLALTLFMFTACRVSDVVSLGRGAELVQGGITYLDWQPAKKGSARVTVPIMPPLADAIRAQKIVGPAYLLTSHGKPFRSSAAFGNWFRDRVAEAGLENRSPHGIRKAAGELMALHGATQYHIMACHGHTQAKTSEVYTRGVNRQRLAAEAMQKMGGMDW